MKRILFAALLCCISSTIFAQWADSLKVVNNTKCDIFYTLIGAPAGSCAPSVPSANITQAGLSTITYPPAPAGWPASPFSYNAARIYSGPPTACPNPVGMVFNPCAGSPQVYGYAANTVRCVFCKQITATWTPPTTAGGMATLTFN